MSPALLANSSLIKLLSRWQNVHLVERAAGEVARQCRASLWQRVYPRTASMGIAEIRGYIRAQSVGCIATEVKRVLSHRRLNPNLYNRVMDAAVDQLVARVAHDVLSGELPASTRPMAA